MNVTNTFQFLLTEGPGLYLLPLVTHPQCKESTQNLLLKHRKGIDFPLLNTGIH